VAISDADRAMVVGECKWSRRPVGTDVVEDLLGKGQLIDPGGAWPNRSLLLFSRSGFTPAATRMAADNSIQLVTPDEMV
jgi:hypothetical protein